MFTRRAALMGGALIAASPYVIKTAMADEVRSGRNELYEGSDGSRGYLIERSLEPGILSARADDGDVLKSEFVGFPAEPFSSSLHGLDEHETHVGSSNSEHKSREARATADVAGNTRAEQWSKQHAVQNVTRP